MKNIVIFDRKLFRFILVGVINTIVGSTIMFALYNAARLSYWLSSACHYFFTFGVRCWSAFMVIAFIMTIVFSYLTGYGVSKPVINYLLRESPQKIRENTALFAGMCLFTGINYLGQRLIVFRGNE